MKLLNYKITGYKGLKNDFYIDLTTRSKIMGYDYEDEVLNIHDAINIPTTTVITGKNSSGKTTILSATELIFELLHTGRIKYNERFDTSKNIKLEVTFIDEAILYKYSTVIYYEGNNSLDSNENMKFKEEVLKRRVYKNSYKKDNLSKSFVIDNNYDNSVDDTSLLFELTRTKFPYIFFSNLVYDRSPYNSNVLNVIISDDLISNQLLNKIVTLFDSTISSIKYVPEEEKYEITSKDNTIRISKKSLSNYLSDGTKKGVVLFSVAIWMLKTGGTLIIDEIENSFHKILVENLILIFNDKRINKNQGNLILSTHYVEILDIFRRRDNIFISRNNKDGINIYNFAEHYDERTELRKSKLFNANVFGTLINYEAMMDVKRGMIDEVSSTSRRKKWVSFSPIFN